jgi:predicted flap endonuclease-1-like 5' DNA nuclease
VFEMPVTGFLGFPPFAVECVVVVRWLGAWRDRLDAPAVRWARAVTMVIGPAAVIAMFAAVDPVTLDSVYVPLAGLEMMTPAARARLVEAGVTSPERFLRETADVSARAAWAERLGMAADDLDRLRPRVALLLHRGIGAQRARDLEALGIHTVDDLARWPPSALAASLAARQPLDPRNRFLERRVRVWTDAAAARGRGGP